MPLELTSERLVPKEIYSRASLAKFFGLQNGGSINTGVFRPDKTRYKSIWLFVTEEKEADMQQYVDKLDGDLLYWQGQQQQGTDSLVINHKAAGLEILVFVRKHKREHPHGAFVFEGCFEYEHHDATSRPTNFVLRRTIKEEKRALPDTPLERATIYALREPANWLSKIAFESLVSLMSKLKGLQLHYVPLSLLVAEALNNCLNNAEIMDILPNIDNKLTSVVNRLLVETHNCHSDEILTHCQEWARHHGNELGKYLYDSLIMLFASEALLDSPDLNLQEFSRTCFASGKTPIWQLSPDFIQVHPIWINYLQDFAPLISESLNSSTEETEIYEDPLLKSEESDEQLSLSLNNQALAAEQNEECFYGNASSSKAFATLATQANLKEEEKEEQLEEISDESDKILESQVIPSEHDIDTDAHRLTENFPESHVELLEQDSSDSDNAPTRDLEPLEIYPGELADFLPLLKQVDPLEFSHIRRFAPFLNEANLGQLFFLLTIVDIVQRQHREDTLITLFAASQYFFSRLWFFYMRGIHTGLDDLLKDPTRFFAKPVTREALFRDSMLTSVRQAVSRRIQNDDIENLRRLSETLSKQFYLFESSSSFIRLSPTVYSELKSHGTLLSKYCAAVIAVKLANDEAISEEFISELFGEEPALCYETTVLFLSVADQDAEQKQSLKQSAFSVVTENKAPAAKEESEEEEEEEEKPPHQNGRLTSSDKGANCAQIPNHQLIDDLETLINWPEGIEKLDSLFLNTSASYKLLLFGAILELVRKTKLEIFSYDLLVVEMLVIAGRLITLNTNISFGSSDHVISELNRLGIFAQKYGTSWTSSKENTLRLQAETSSDHVKKRLMRYVPHLLIRPFFKQYLDGITQESEIQPIIERHSRDLFQSVRPIYCISDNSDALIPHPIWREFFNRHFESLVKWWQAKFIDFLLVRNPALEHDDLDFGITTQLDAKLSESCSLERNSETLVAAVPKGTINSADIAPLQESEKPDTNSALICEAASSEASTSAQLLEHSYTASYIPVENSHTESLERIFNKDARLATESLQHLAPHDNEVCLPPDRNDIGLFKGLDYLSGEESIQKAFMVVAQRLSQLPAPRSLCQLDITEYDYEFLRLWALTLDAPTARHMLIDAPRFFLSKDSSFTKQTAIGCLLFMLCAESTRREGQEGAIWPLFMQLFDSSLDDIITSQRYDGQVSYQVKASIKSAIETLGLRNVLGCDDQAYFLVSTFLQFGFTRNGIRNLPVWLGRQNLTQSIVSLTSDHSTNYASDFGYIWQKLHAFYYRRITRFDLLNTLQNSCWILGDWHEEIIRVLENPDSRLDLPLHGYLRSKNANSSPFTSKLRWTDHCPPLFEVKINFENLHLDAGQKYKISVQQTEYDVFFYNNEWKLNTPIILKTFGREIPIDIKNAEGVSELFTTVSLWQEADYQVFDAVSGQLLEVDGALKRSRAYMLIISADLQTSHEVASVHTKPEIGMTFLYLTEGWPEDFQLLLDGEVLWTATDESGSITIPQEVKSIQIVQERKTLNTAEPVTFAVKGETDETRVTALRVNGVSHEVRWTGQRTETTQQIALGSLGSNNKLPITLKVKHKGKQYVVRRKINLTVKGSAIWNGVKWDSIEEDEILDAEECKDKYLLCSYDMLKGAASDFGLFESKIFVCRMSNSKMKPFTKGFGGELEIRKFFNPSPKESPVCIASGVINRGVVRSFYDISASEVRIELKHPISISESHTIVVWPSDSEPILLKPKDVIQSSSTTLDFVPFSASTEIAVAIAYAGEWMGGDWPPNLEHFLESASLRMEPEKLAALLQWFKWPLLEAKNLRAVRSFIYKYPDAALSAWIGADSLHPSLSHDKLNYFSDWHSVVQELFEQWSPAKSNILRVTSALYGDEVDSLATIPIARAASKLWAVSPILLLKYLKGCATCCSSNNRAFDRTVISDLLEKEILGGSNLSTASTVLDNCAKQFGIDNRFAEHLVTECLDQLKVNVTPEYAKLNNLYTLLSRPEGRRLISLKIVDYFRKSRI